jgi:phosphocarrier protein HPr
MVISEVGLHARPASILVQRANQFHSQVSIQKTGEGSITVNAKSIIHVLTLGVNKGDEIELIIDGEDENAAAEMLKSLLDSDFSEP